MSLPNSTPLGQAKTWLRSRLEKGERCPLCTQHAKIYKRKINSTMARTLITLWRTADFDFAHGPSLPGDTHEISQLVWWGLVEEESRVRPDGGRAGWWRITSRGARFVKGLITVPKYAEIYDSRLLKLDPTTMVTIKDALGSRFNYSELMSGV